MNKISDYINSYTYKRKNIYVYPVYTIHRHKFIYPISMYIYIHMYIIDLVTVGLQGVGSGDRADRVDRGNGLGRKAWMVLPG